MEDPPLWEGGVIRTRNEKLTACCIRLAFGSLPDNLSDNFHDWLPASEPNNSLETRSIQHE